MELKHEDGTLTLSMSGSKVGSVSTVKANEDEITLSVQGDMAMITPNSYQSLAMRTANNNLTRSQFLSNAAMGLAGESGEFVDQVKKVNYQGHKLDPNKLKEELGDILWYAAQAAEALGTTLEEIMIGNIKKLKERYPSGFDPDKSINRIE